MIAQSAIHQTEYRPDNGQGVEDGCQVDSGDSSRGKGTLRDGIARSAMTRVNGTEGEVR